MIKKFIVSLKKIGIKKTIIKTFFYFSIENYKRRSTKKKIFGIKSAEGRFVEIYQTNFWQGESRSGTGSTYNATRNIRVHLPKILEKFKIKKLFDAACGDFNWMSQVVKNLEINYLGADIVKELILINKKKYENHKIKFSHLDVRFDKLPDADLMLCRDCLFHFSDKDVFLFLKNFLSSNIDYLLLTSHLNEEHIFENRDIITGDFRNIDIFSEPFNFEKNYLYSFDDREDETQNFKQMYLFSKLQIKNYIMKNP